MFKRGMDSQGQLSVEYLLLLVVIFAVFGGMITYLIIPSIDAGNDISDVSGTSNTVNSIVNAVNLVYANGPGAKRTLRVYIPQDNTRLYRGGTYVNMTTILSDGTNKTISGVTSYRLATNSGPIMTKGWHSINVQWNNGETFIRMEVIS